MTDRFIDRARELDALEASWRRRPAQLIIVLGRRRIGKTALLHQFATRHPIVHYVATRLPESQQLMELGTIVGRAIGDPLLTENGFRDWRQVLHVLGQGRSKLALVLDEFPYLVEANQALPSLLQKAWDEDLSGRQAWLAISGSSIAMMERETMDARAPLFGRRTGLLRLQPLGAEAIREFVPQYSDEEAVRTAAVFGGIPQYLQMIDSSRPILANIRDLVVGDGAPLRDEVEFLLRQELVETRVYFGILAAIAAGQRKLSEIANTTGITATGLTKYLSVLQVLGIVQREVPATEDQPEKSRKGLYWIADPFVRFWFRHIRPGTTLIETGRGEVVLATIEEDLDVMAAAVYEDLCRAAVSAGRISGEWDRVGRWWDRTSEIDVLAIGKGGQILAGEAKWSRKPVGTNILDDLKQKLDRSGLLAANRQTARPTPTYALFSRSGFTPALRATAAAARDVVLVSGMP